MLAFSPAFQRLFSRLVGAYQSSRWSARAIPGFVEAYGIDMSQFVAPPGGFASFNDFFIRAVRPEARPFPSDPATLGAPAEGRLTVFPVDSPSIVLTVKGNPVPLATLLGDEELAAGFRGGHVWVFRLCPVDYHRFHFHDAGTPSPPRRLGDRLHSVHPVAQRRVPDLFVRNERQVCTLDGERFGPSVLLEIGAMGVGTIVQSHAPGQPVVAGQEKGWFAFGGSTTVLLTRGDRVEPAADLLERTAAGSESLVRLGEAIGRAR